MGFVQVRSNPTFLRLLTALYRLGTVRLALALAVISDSNDILINAQLEFNDVMILACVSIGAGSVLNVGRGGGGGLENYNIMLNRTEIERLHAELAIAIKIHK